MVLRLSDAVGATIADNEGTGTIYDNDPAPPATPEPPEIAISSFYSDGTNLLVSYTITGDLLEGSSFYIGIYRSPDGSDLGDRLERVAGTSSSYMQTVTIEPTFDDPQEDYYLIARVDCDETVVETSEAKRDHRAVEPDGAGSLGGSGAVEPI